MLRVLAVPFIAISLTFIWNYFVFAQLTSGGSPSQLVNDGVASFWTAYEPTELIGPPAKTNSSDVIELSDLPQVHTSTCLPSMDNQVVKLEQDPYGYGVMDTLLCPESSASGRPAGIHETPDTSVTNDINGISCWDTFGGPHRELSGKPLSTDSRRSTQCNVRFRQIDSLGFTGLSGINCWDLNGNRNNDPEEDLNDDGRFDASDCQGVEGPIGPTGLVRLIAPNGLSGTNCWDVNGDRFDDPDEDTNGDGLFDALDCQGLPGKNGTPGEIGPAGVDGIDGLAGIHCWDTNRNRINDPAEDLDGDGKYTTGDCRGAAGIHCWDTNRNRINDPAEDLDGDGKYTTGDCRGSPGISCWDVNLNQIDDPEEDINGDGLFNVSDCQGAAGPIGPPGAPGVSGIDCWDVNGNRVDDPEEDVNGDGLFDPLDCRGDAGPAGVDGKKGAMGPPGSAGAAGTPGASGINCWDTNGNRVDDPKEDVNGDGTFDALDCQSDLVGPAGVAGPPGADGRPGINCWDINGNRVDDPEEDVNGDEIFSALDCQVDASQISVPGETIDSARFTRVISSTGTNSTGIKTLTVFCPEQKQVLFGGGSINGPENGANWFRNIPASHADTSSSWRVTAEVWRTGSLRSDDCNCDGDWSLTVWAICTEIGQITEIITDEKGD